MKIKVYLLYQARTLKAKGRSIRWCIEKWNLLTVFGWHLKPASSLWAQLWLPTPLWVQFERKSWVPVQNKLSRRMGPVPCPNGARCKAVAPLIKNSEWVLAESICVWERAHHVARIPAVCKPRLHQNHSRSHRTQCPRFGCCRTQHGPPWHWSHSQGGDHHLSTLKYNAMFVHTITKASERTYRKELLILLQWNL